MMPLRSSNIRSASLVLLAPLVIACADTLLAPNTDVGLRVWAEVMPRSMSVRDTQTVIRIRMYVQNPSRREVRVVSGGPPYVFTGDPAQTQGLWGSVRIGCDAKPLNCGPSVDWWGDSVYVIPARTTQYSQELVTLREWRERGWTPTLGEYRVRVWFNGREGESAVLRFRP